jgi:mono/diheme cytochrome c family protein
MVFNRRGLAGTAYVSMLAPSAVVLLTAVTGTPATAQDAPVLEENRPLESKIADIENGRRVARTLCSACHLIGEPSEGPAKADVPSFPSIAVRPNQSTEALTNWLIAPHAPMPDPHLTRVEIRDLAGYILSLKKAD